VIRSFVFSKGSVIAQDVVLDALKVMLYDSDIHIWVDVEAPSEEETKTLLSDVFGFHPLAIEDCVTLSERAKVDDYESYILLVTHGVDFSSGAFRTKELNMFIGKNFLVTYHHEAMKSIAATIDRVQRNAPAVAKAPDRLTYTILDAMLENYAPATDQLAQAVLELEGSVTTVPSKKVLNQVMSLKTEVMRLHQIIMPQREVMAHISHGEFKVVRTTMLPYYRDLLDQLSRLSDYTDSYRDSITNTLQVHFNLQQMEINRVIKVLTVLATLCMPALIITSFYGMNVGHLPNTTWSWESSYLVIFLMTGLFTGMVYWFLKYRKWM
jgi:magnesium transporter